MHLIKLVVISLLCIKQLVTSNLTDSFTEELYIKPLYSEQIYAHFHFTTKWDTDPELESFRHAHLFPRALGEILQRYNVRELHVTLTNGLWRYETWGYPVNDAAPGAEVWAWFKPNTNDVDKNWKGLANSLSGLLCASFNFIDTSNSIKPEFSFRPSGIISENLNTSFVRYSSLPREIVCTENLTPWKKLLPCDSRNGLASLLNSGYIHNTRYHSLSIDVRSVCRDASCEVPSLELLQSVDLVYDYKILGNKNWSLRKLFGQGLMGSCPLASISNIYVDVTSNNSVPFELIPTPDDYLISYCGGHVNTFAKYHVKPYAMSIQATYSGSQNVLVNLPPALYGNQYLTGYGQERGGIVTKLYNNHWGSLDIVVLQNIPWFIPVYLHTLSVMSNNKKNEPVLIRYVPGRQRIRPYHLEMLLKLPARSTTTISIEFDYIFLKWQEYPPDANHGFYVGSTVISTVLPLARNYTGLPQDGSLFSDSFNASRSGYLVRIRTENMVVTLPTPDFSMPYNVICLACTVVALAFGPLHNITTKRLILRAKSTETLLVKIKNRFLRLFGRCESEQDTKNETKN